MFIPLRVISSYTFLKSALKVEEIASIAFKNGYPGIGVADSNHLYSLPSLVNELDKKKKKYLIGVEFVIDEDYFICYANSEQGYLNLIYLSAFVSKENLTIEELKKHHDGLTIVLETNHGHFLSFEEEEQKVFVDRYALISKAIGNFYLGIEITNKKEFAKAKKIREFAKEYCYDTIAFPRIRYLNKEDAIKVKMLEAIDKNEVLKQKEENGEEYFHDELYYHKLYTKEEIANTEKLLNESTFSFHKKRGEVMHFPVEDSVKEIKLKVAQGLKDKNIYDEKHISRAKYELEVITSMGYADYFLIVSDYVSYARNNNILVGPGRGSAAGSLIAYALNITEVDPLDYDLQFERFLNKARKSMPDIDVDFMDTRRDEMIQYMRDKYGNDNVANIIAFQTIQAKQSIRDVGRIYNIPNHHIDLLSKSVPDKMTLREAYKKAPQFKKLVDSDRYFLEIVSLASKIEGLPRQAGLHAAGVILNNTPLINSLPVTIDLDDRFISQYEKDYLEEQGFLKMDFLSLRNLSTIQYCLDLIKTNKGIDLSFYDLPYQEKEIFDLIRTTKTIGVFQIESKGMQNAIKIIKPTEFNDIVTLLAIFRPGPMDNIKDYANQKKNKDKIKYLSESLKEILSPTYGILIYQEQVNKIATSMAGYSPEDADLFRRAISHKDKVEIAKNKTRFISGAINNGYSEKDAKEMFDRIEKFADYGFNKSHAVVYAIIACRMAYLKAHYPLEFYCSILTISSGSTDHKFSDYVSEMKSQGYKVLLPNINLSTKDYKVIDKGILFPLSEIKGIMSNAIDKIIDDRTVNGEYKDFFDFVSRMYHLGISDMTINKLIDAGALDIFNPSRASMRNTLRYALQLAELSYDKNGQLILDATLENQKQFFVDSDDPLDNLYFEYEALGINLSDNPLKYKKDLLEANKVTPIEKVDSTYGIITVAGIISNIKTIKVKKNDSTMAFIKIFDESGELEVTVFSKVYQDCYQLLKRNNIILVKGRFDHHRDESSFVADEIKLLEE